MRIDGGIRRPRNPEKSEEKIPERSLKTLAVPPKRDQTRVWTNIRQSRLLENSCRYLANESSPAMGELLILALQFQLSVFPISTFDFRPLHSAFESRRHSPTHVNAKHATGIQRTSFWIKNVMK
jgi:hypothetical protein